jgi:hypothetical protein
VSAASSRCSTSSADKRAEVFDLNHGMQFTPMAQITGSDDLDVCGVTPTSS